MIDASNGIAEAKAGNHPNSTVTAARVVHSVVHSSFRPSETPAFSGEVDAVHQRPVEVEQKHRLDAHGSGSSSGRRH